MDDLHSKEYTLRMNIVDYADNYQGTKYTYAGRDPRKGFDCSGFTYFVMKKYGIELSPSSRLQEKQGRSIRIKDVKPGDLVFYRRSPLGRVFHVSLVYANDPDGIKVIHSTSRGVVIDNITTSSYWAPKISTARDVVSR
jgi:cell wall-associated NlpC family hydrolase